MLIILLTLTVFVIFAVNYFLKYRRLPPGPIGLPFIGYYPFLGEIPSKTIAELSKKYGDVLTINILGDNYWFLNSIEAIEEALVKKGDVFTGRPYREEYSFYGLLSSNCSGVLGGNEWKTNFRFIVGNLASLGMGKSEFEYKVHELLDRVEDYVESKKGVANDYFEILTNFASNIITTLSFSKQYDYNDPEYVFIRERVHNIFMSFAYMNFVLTGFGFKVLTTINPRYAKKVEKNKNELRKYIDTLIDERLKSFDPNNCKDLLDYFLKQKNADNSELFSRKAISARLMELTLAGTETTSATLYHALYLMSLNPKIQEKVYNEITEIYGSEGIVSYADRHRLQYTQAVISEVHRFICMVSLVDTHTNIEATTLCGFEVPKREKIIANFYAVSRNPKYFKNPDEFDPTNFLDTNGNYLPNKALIPFSTGVRKCMGATLAEVDIFLAFTRLMQRFQWTQPTQDTDSIIGVSEGLLRLLSANKVCAIRR